MLVVLASPVLPLRLGIQVAVFSGSLFFGSTEEQEAFVSFLGLCPLQHTLAQEKAFDAGHIERSTFVRPEHRKDKGSANERVFDLLHDTCHFECSPIPLVMALVEVRGHGQLQECSSHVASLLLLGRCSPLDY